MLRSTKSSFDGRFYVELTSRQALVRHMAHQDLSVAKLARMIGRSKATVGHLHSGARTTTSSATAKAIEKALGMPPCTLFLPKVEPGARTGIRRAA
jgi:transcriptional regulator with XRE-family HTH domain